MGLYMTFVHSDKERMFTHAEIESIWERFFGSKWSAKHIGQTYGVSGQHIARVIDSESARRWYKDHPHETNRTDLFS